jgi:hypothetical protein
MVDTMVSTAEAILDARPEDPPYEAEIIAAAERRLRMIVLGVPQWRSSGSGAPMAAPRSGAPFGYAPAAR